MVWSTHLSSVSEATHCFVTALGLIQYFSTQGEASKCLWMAFGWSRVDWPAKPEPLLSCRNCRPSFCSYIMLDRLIVHYHRQWQFVCTVNIASFCVYYNTQSLCLTLLAEFVGETNCRLPVASVMLLLLPNMWRWINKKYFTHST